MEISLRIQHEASLHASNCCITFTYDQKNVPDSIFYRHIQLFNKHLRKYFKVRFFCACETGSVNGRPHYHVIYFGFTPPDKYIWRQKKGQTYYRSPIIEQLWQKGHVELSDVNPAAAQYVAGYVAKKDNTDAFSRCSTNPGIGHGWISQYYNDVYKHDCIHHLSKDNNTLRLPVPRYYDKFIQKHHPDLWRTVAQKRQDIKYERIKKVMLDEAAMLRLSRSQIIRQKRDMVSLTALD